MGLGRKDWLEYFEDFMKGPQVTDPGQQLIALRNLFGKEVGQIIKELLTDSPFSYQDWREALNSNFLHKRNIDYERYSFNLASQEKDESMGEFILQLKCLAQYCAFDSFTTEDALRLLILEECQSKSLRRRLLKKRHSLDEIEEMTRIKQKNMQRTWKQER
ncbi:hypothetical protein NDU88_007167 [Pleurodeles waltl]|uniref:Retrotransposon gag domain-containing protein n=1 Tax=Pleurodeles waltl TaxID=8319 RepID=A0AAV7N3J2_PLEWA|nr:hypothetical protein NDU88_007167 [Pleurodeles waltl]